MKSRITVCAFLLTLLISRSAFGYPVPSPSPSGWHPLPVTKMSAPLNPHACEYRLVVGSAYQSPHYSAGAVIRLNTFEDNHSFEEVSVGTYITDRELYRLLSYQSMRIDPLPASAPTLESFRAGGFYASFWHTPGGKEIRDLDCSILVRQNEIWANGRYSRTATLYLTLQIDDPTQIPPGLEFFSEVPMSWDRIRLEEKCS